MNRIVWIGCIIGAMAVPALAQQSSDYRQGYADGFRDGYAKAQQEARQSFRNEQNAQARTAVISIQSAFYGEEYGNARCDATRFVARAAQGRRDATIQVSNDICGDPARGKRKQLTVTFYCGPVSKTESAYEHRQLSLSCRS